MSDENDRPWERVLDVLGKQTSDLSVIKSSLRRIERLLGHVHMGVEALVSLPLKVGHAALLDAANIANPETQRARIMDAIKSLSEAHSLEPPLNAAHAAASVAVCYELLGETAAATPWLRRSYDSLTAAYLDSLGRARLAFRKRKRWHYLSFVAIGIPVLVWDGLTDWESRQTDIVGARQTAEMMERLAPELERRGAVVLTPNELAALPRLFDRRSSDDHDGRGEGLDRSMLFP